MKKIWYWIRELTGDPVITAKSYPSFDFVQNEKVISTVDPVKGICIMIPPNWRVGSFWYDHPAGYRAFLGEHTSLIRDGKEIAVGWNGIGNPPTLETLHTGDTFAFKLKIGGVPVSSEYCHIRVSLKT